MGQRVGNASVIDLVYCAAGNRRFAQIAIDAGFLYGAQLPNTIYHAPYFVDQDWEHPNRERYMQALAQHRPHLASVLDWERPEQLPEVLAWAEDAAQFAGEVIVIPKVQGGVRLLPRVIGGRSVRLGYSVPTSFAGTELGLWEFVGWPVHLLGGSPKNQMRLTRYLDVRSADGNYMGRKARRYVQCFDGRRWVQLSATGDLSKQDAIYRAFEISCRNIMAAWGKL